MLMIELLTTLICWLQLYCCVLLESFLQQKSLWRPWETQLIYYTQELEKRYVYGG